MNLETLQTHARLRLRTNRRVALHQLNGSQNFSKWMDWQPNPSVLPFWILHPGGLQRQNSKNTFTSSRPLLRGTNCATVVVLRRWSSCPAFLFATTVAVVIICIAYM